MAARPGDGHSVQNLEKVKIQHLHQPVSGAAGGIQLAPLIEHLLCVAENLIHAAADVQFTLPFAAIALVGQCQLVTQIVKAVVHRRGRQHQHTCARTGADDFVHQAGVTVFFSLIVHIPAIAEIVGFIDHDQVVGAPVQFTQVDLAGKSFVPA